MKKLILACMALAIAGCAPLMNGTEDKAVAVAATPAVDAVKTPLKETARNAPPPRSGEMAFAAEKVAKEAGCYRSESATLMAKRTGIEFYRVGCDNGRQVLVKCELRQCRIAN
jgi:hypothetical protein